MRYYHGQELPWTVKYEFIGGPFHRTEVAVHGEWVFEDRRHPSDGVKFIPQRTIVLQKFEAEPEGIRQYPPERVMLSTAKVASALYVLTKVADKDNNIVWTGFVEQTLYRDWMNLT